MKPLRRWPIIRHIRALCAVWQYCWRAGWVWRITESSQMDDNPLFTSDRARARRIWKGQE